MSSHSHNKSRSARHGKKNPKEMSRYAKYIAILVIVTLVLIAASCRAGGGGVFDGNRAFQHVVAQTALGPRPVGSESLISTANYIESHLTSMGWQSRRIVGEFRGVPIRNIVAEKDHGQGPVVLIGAHYDTRPVADRDPVASMRGEPILGANDGASGVAVLLELARVYDARKSGCNVMLAFFDGEDKGGIDDWSFSVGADIVAEELAGTVSAMILLDMVGDRDLRIFYEGNSDGGLARDIWSVARSLGYGEYFVPEVRYTLMDDHVPFLRRGVPAVDIIDFDYPYWHTTADTVDHVSAESLEIVGKVLLEYLYRR